MVKLNELWEITGMRWNPPRIGWNPPLTVSRPSWTLETHMREVAVDDENRDGIDGEAPHGVRC